MLFSQHTSSAATKSPASLLLPSAMPSSSSLNNCTRTKVAQKPIFNNDSHKYARQNIAQRTVWETTVLILLANIITNPVQAPQPNVPRKHCTFRHNLDCLCVSSLYITCFLLLHLTCLNFLLPIIFLFLFTSLSSSHHATVFRNLEQYLHSARIYPI